MMQTDEQFGSDLGARMRSELTEVHASGDLLPGVRRRLARRTRMIRMAVVTPVVMVAAVALVIATVGQTRPRGTPIIAHGGPDTSGAAATSSAPPLADAAYVLTQTEQSLGRATDYVILSIERYGTVDHTDTWLDRTTKQFRTDVYDNMPLPQPTTSTGLYVAPPAPPFNGPVRLVQSAAYTDEGHGNLRNLVEVNYDQKTYSFDARVSAPPIQTDSPIVDPTDANSVRSAVQRGRVLVLGEETVNGYDTLHLRIQHISPNPNSVIDLWVERATFLPVQEYAYRDGLDMSAEAVLRTTYSWLPRTPENLAHLTLTPPPGFRKIG
jgi:hypothetical protein